MTFMQKWNVPIKLFAILLLIATATCVLGQSANAKSPHDLSHIFACSDVSGSGTAQSCTTFLTFAPAAGRLCRLHHHHGEYRHWLDPECEQQ